MTSIHFHTVAFVYLSPYSFVMLCLCIVFATSLYSTCSTITSAWCGEACGVFIRFNIPAGVCFLIVHEWLHTSTKLTLEWCFCNFSHSNLLLPFSIWLSPSYTTLLFINLLPFIITISVSLLCESHLDLSPSNTLLATLELECICWDLYAYHWYIVWFDFG